MEESGRLNGRILLTGATGFVGRAVWERWRGLSQPAVRLLVHKNVPVSPGPPQSESVYADLARPETLGGICEGVDTVLHLAGYIGDDQKRCDAVNGQGTEALVEQARMSGLHRFIYLSSAGIYGYAVHRNARETEVKVRPATPISRSRVRAEEAVLDLGGIVLRPLFVYGRGDTRFIPVLLRALDRFPFMINGGKARLSVIAVDDLAAGLIALTTETWTENHRGIFHVNDGHPVRLSEIAAVLAQCVGSGLPTISVPFFIAHNMLRLSGQRIFQKAGQSSLKHRLFLVSRDHFYDSSKLWDLVSVKPGPPLPEVLPRYADWYRQFVRVKKGEGRP